MILAAVLALGIGGTLRWSLSRKHSATAARPTLGSAGALPLGKPAATLVLRPGFRPGPFFPVGPVTGAKDATLRAVLAANSAALRDYRLEPFADPKATASFDGKRWSWRKRVGCGLGDMEAEVSIAPDGTVANIRVEYQTLRLARAVNRE